MSANHLPRRSGVPHALAAGTLLAILALAFAPVLMDLNRIWHGNAQYSHGYLVPVFSVGLLWLRRESLRTAELRPSLWGIPLLAGGLALRHAATYVHIEWFEQLSLIACIPGIVVAAGGREALRWSWPAIAFLLFMLPLPYRFEVALQDPLRKIGTVASAYVMQAIGLPAVAQGNVIEVNEIRIGVVEACSGLRMLTVFFALSTAVALMSHRRIGERLLIVASAVPIAIVVNVVRITLTGILYSLHYDDLAGFIHDKAAAFVMMPLALGLLWLETIYLSRLIVEEVVDPTRSPLAAVAAVMPQQEFVARKRAADAVGK